MISTRKVGIIHPWMPQYRTPFFDELSRRLAVDNVSLEVFYGETPPEWQARNDSNTPAGMACLPTRFIRVGSRVLAYKSVAGVKSEGPFDLLILEQAVRNLETYQLLLTRKLYDRLAYWGHGRTYTKSKSALEEMAKTKLTLRANWFFGYTDGGVDRMVEKGFSRTNSTVVQNSIDTRSFRADLESISDDLVAEFRGQHDLTADTCLYVGGIDESKRIEFLVESSRRVYDRNRDFRLVVVGSGDGLPALRALSESLPWLTVLGPLFGIDKALAFRSAAILLNPGRVGLIAVDSLTAGVPLVTTDWPFHAPEFEYLRDGVTAIVTPDSVDDYTSAVLDIVSNRKLVAQLRRQCLAEAEDFSTELMAARFHRGIMSALNI